MAMVKRVESRARFMGSLSKDKDVLEEIADICRKQEINLGRVEAFGAVQKACFGFYDQSTHEYKYISIDEPLEIVKLIGNISIRDNAPFVHAHIALADKTGRAYGGHLAPGTIVFACEFIIEAFDGPTLARELDESTGLFLWTAGE